MKLRKINLLFTLLLIGILSTHAQTITLEGGYYNPKRIGPSTSETYFDAIRIGVLAEYDWKYNFGIQSGLFYQVGYSNKTQKYSMTGDSVVYNTWDHALAIPLRIVYNQRLFKDFKIFGFAGPNIQIGLFQSQATDAYLTESIAEMTGIESGKADLYSSGKINRINLQLGAGGGVQWREFSLKSGYDWGLNNLDRTKSDYVTQGNWYVTFGYRIK